MHQTTLTAIKSILATDASISPEHRAQLVTSLRNHGKGKELSQREKTRIVRRREAAERLGVSLRTVDNWAREGVLNKIRIPGRQRACGFASEEIETLIASGTEADQ